MLQTGLLDIPNGAMGSSRKPALTVKRPTRRSHLMILPLTGAATTPSLCLEIQATCSTSTPTISLKILMRVPARLPLGRLTIPMMMSTTMTIRETTALCLLSPTLLCLALWASLELLLLVVVVADPKARLSST